MVNFNMFIFYKLSWDILRNNVQNGSYKYFRGMVKGSTLSAGFQIGSALLYEVRGIVQDNEFDKAQWLAMKDSTPLRSKAYRGNELLPRDEKWVHPS